MTRFIFLILILKNALGFGQTPKSMLGFHVSGFHAIDMHYPGELSAKGFEYEFIHQVSLNKTFAFQYSLKATKSTDIDPTRDAKEFSSEYANPHQIKQINSNAPNYYLTIRPIIYIIKNWVYLQTGAFIGYVSMADLELNFVGKFDPSFPDPLHIATTSDPGLGFGFFGGLGNQFRLGKNITLQASFAINHHRYNFKNVVIAYDGVEEKFSNLFIKYPSFNAGLGLFWTF